MKKSILTALVVALALMLSNFAAAGQIKIPGIFKPKQNPPVETPQTPNGQNRNPQNASQQSSGERLWTASGDYVDDGFTWFNTIETSQRAANPALTDYTGWTLKPSIRAAHPSPGRRCHAEPPALA